MIKEKVQQPMTPVHACNDVSLVQEKERKRKRKAILRVIVTLANLLSA